MGNRYEILLKQGTLEVELSSDDDYFMTKQLNKWYQALLDPSISFKPPASPPLSSSHAPSKLAEKPAREEPVLRNFSETQSQSNAQNQTSAEPQNAENQLIQASSSQTSSSAQEPEPDFTEDDLDALLQEGLTDLSHHQAELSQPSEPLTTRQERFIEADVPSDPVSAEVPSSEPVSKKPVIEDDFEAVMASIEEDLQAESPQVPPQSLKTREFKDEMAIASVDAPEPDLPKFTVPKPNPDALGIRKVDLEMVESLTDLYERSTAQTPEDFLMLSAYYLSFCEREPKYSLKKINALIVKSGLTPVNHSVIEAALEKQLIELVPDMTGTAEVIEYRITASGSVSGKTFTESLL
jgi:hypothetical protein